MYKKYIKKLTKAQEKKMPEYAQKWIDIGLRTGETDWDTFDRYFPICYAKAGIKYPKNVVRVQSPLVGALTASIASSLLQKNNNGNVVERAVGNAVAGAVGNAVAGAVRDAVDTAVDTAVAAAVADAVADAVRDAMDTAVRDAVDTAVDTAVAAAVDTAVDTAVRDAVDTAVDTAVRDAVDTAVAAAVADAMDTAVRDAMDTAVRDAMEIKVISLKKNMLNLSWHYWLGGQFWVGGWYWGVAFVNFFFDICGLKLSKDIMDRALAYRKVCESVNYIWPNNNFVIVCARPSHIDRDEQGRLHSTTRKAIQYSDGWGLWMIHGVRVNEKIVKTPELLTKQDWLNEKNLEVKRVIQERMGERFVTEIGGKVIGKHTDPHIGEVIEIDISPDPEKKAYYLHAQDWSTDRMYFLWVPHVIAGEMDKVWPNMSDPMCAQAWTYSDESKGEIISHDDMQALYLRGIKRT